MVIDIRTGTTAPYASIDFSILEPVHLLPNDDLFCELSAYLIGICADSKQSNIKILDAKSLKSRFLETLSSRDKDKCAALLKVLKGPSISLKDLAVAVDLLPCDMSLSDSKNLAPHYLHPKPNVAYVRQFRQHLLYGSVLPGPIEVVQSLVPGERIEVVIEESSSKTLETQIEEENQQSFETEIGRTNSSELSENIQRTLSTVSTTRVGADGGVNFAVWSASASAEFTNTNSDVTASQKASKFSQQITSRQSEKIQKRTKISTRLVEQTSSKTSTRRLLENKSDRLLQYGFRRLNYEVVSKVQDLGYELALTFEVKNPGHFLSPAEFADAFPKVSLTAVSNPKKISQVVSVQVPFVGDWTLSYKGQAPGILGITEESFLKFRDTATITDISVDVQSGRNDWQEGPNLGLDGMIVASFRSDSTKPKNPRFILTFRLTITIQEEVALPKSIVDLAEKYGQGKPELVALLSRYSVRRRRYADGLFEEELGVLLAHTLGQIVSKNALGGNKTEEEICQLLDEVFDLSAAVYVLPKIGTVDAVNLRVDRAKSTYMIPSDPADAYPSPVGSSFNWKRVPDADDTRHRFINAPSATLVLPIKPHHLELGFSLGNIDPTLQRVKEVIRRKNRFDAGKAVVAAEDLRQESKDLLSSLDPTTDVRPWLDDENVALESLEWRHVYPIVSAQNVRIPVDGFAHEELTLDHRDVTKKSRKPWWCFL